MTAQTTSIQSPDKLLSREDIGTNIRLRSEVTATPAV